MLNLKWLLWTIPVLIVLMSTSADAGFQLLESHDYAWKAYDPDTGNLIGQVDVNEKYAYIDSGPYVGHYYYLYTVFNFTSNPAIDIYNFHVENQGGMNLVASVSYPALWIGVSNPGVIDWDTDSAPVFDPITGFYKGQGAIPMPWGLNSFDVVVKPEAHPLHGTVHGWVTDVQGRKIAEGDVSGITAPTFGSIGDFVWYDTNRNGIQDIGEPGIDGVTVNLYDVSGFVATTTTLGGGVYGFTGLTPGNYLVEFILPAGFVFSPKDQGGDDALDSDADTTTGKTIVTTLSPGENDLTWDAGMYEIPASIGDFVWYDTNRDGIQDTGESGIDGVTVKLYDVIGNLIATTTTSGGGVYGFTNLTPGNYSVEFILPADFVFSPQDQGGDDAIDSDADTTGKTIVTTLSPGENDLTWDAGMYEIPASIGNFVWYDTNRNGIQDVGELGIDGVTVNLYDVIGNLIATTTTSGGGVYGFTNLTPGDYLVEFILPAGFVFSPKDQGGNDALDSDADTTTGKTIVTTLSPGENDLTWDAGMYEIPASIGDFVWNDANANGIQDTGEPGIDGVTVNLYDVFGNLVATTTTSGGGIYGFTDLTPGDYSVEFILPAGFVFSLQNQGSNDDVDSDADTTTGRTTSTTLAPGENDLTWDAGMYQQEQKPFAGCTPGYWKNHPEAWGPTGYTTGQAVSSVFTVPQEIDQQLANKSLIDTLDGGGGPDINGAAQILLRAAVAALLNAAHPDINYPLTVAQIINDVNAALASLNRDTILALATKLDNFNNLGCSCGEPPGGNNPAIDIQKTPDQQTVDSGANVSFTITVTNTGDVALMNVVVTDPQCQVAPTLQSGDTNGDNILQTTETWVYTCTVNNVTQSFTNVATVNAQDGQGNTVSDSDDAVVTVNQPLEGLTPGYWKNHPESWPPTGYTTTQKVNTVFTIPSQIDSKIANKTLIETLGGGGGGGINGAAKILLRAAVAALLNAAHPNINYPLSTTKVITDVNNALASRDRFTMLALADELDKLNNLEGDISATPVLDAKVQVQKPQDTVIDVPRETRVLQNFPNPFNPETWIPFELAKDASVKIEIYDMTGRLVHTLDLGYRPAGYYVNQSAAAYWNGRNFSGERVASGLYFYRLITGERSAVRRMLILK